MEVNDQGQVRLAERQQVRFRSRSGFCSAATARQPDRSEQRNIGFHAFSPAVRKFRERYLKVKSFRSDKSTYAQGELFTGRSASSAAAYSRLDFSGGSESGMSIVIAWSDRGSSGASEALISRLRVLPKWNVVLRSWCFSRFLPFSSVVFA
jgi:hypothetical protein